LQPLRDLGQVEVGVVMDQDVPEGREARQALALAGFSFDRFDLTGYVFNPDDGEPIVVVAGSLGF
jgi:hypothetical protein